MNLRSFETNKVFIFSDTFSDRFREEKRNDYLDEDISDEDDTNATPASPIPSQPSRSPQVHLRVRVTPLLRTPCLAGTCARRCAWLVERA
jgi:hypothetical protein